MKNSRENTSCMPTRRCDERRARFIGWNANWIVVSERGRRETTRVNRATFPPPPPARSPIYIPHPTRKAPPFSPSRFLLPPCSFPDNSHINSRQIEIKTWSIEMQFTRMHHRAARRAPTKIVYESPRANHARVRFPPLAVNCLYFASISDYRVRHRLVTELSV